MDVCWIKSLHSSKFPLLFKIAVWNVCHMHDLVFCQQMQKGIIGEFSIPICPCFPRRLPCNVFCICLLTDTNRYQKYKSVELGDQLMFPPDGLEVLGGLTAPIWDGSRLLDLAEGLPCIARRATWVCDFYKYIFQLEQISSVIWRNTFYKVDKYICKLKKKKMHF